MKLLFLGSPDYAVPSLEALASHHEIVGVVTQPHRRAGRGRHDKSTPVAEVARRLGLTPVIETANINDASTVEELASLAADLTVTIAFGQILRKRALAVTPLGAINAHGSLLPRHRGPSPVQAAILAGDTETGVTIMRMVRKMDAGPIILKSPVELTGAETAGDLHDTQAALSATSLIAAIARIENGTVVEVPQDESQATYCDLITKAEGSLDFAEPADLIARKVRAYSPWPSAFTGMPMKAGTLERVTIAAASASSDSADAAPGTVVTASGESLVIACGTGSLCVAQIKPAGKRQMSAAEFLRGHAVEEGGLATLGG